VLLYSPAFHPLVGGLEAVVAMVATELTGLGEEVTVVTTTPAGGPEPFPFPVVRRPDPRRFLALTRWCDIFFQANVSLKGLWPLALVRRPWVVSHHSWYRRPGGRIAWQDRLKRLLLRHATSITVSRAMAADLTTPSVVIPNPYREDLFYPRPEVPRELELVFVGRLVSEKGIDLLLEALALLGRRGCRPRLTVVGDGPEREALETQAAALGLADRVAWAGVVTGAALAELLCRHRVLAVPSRYQEPFGIVALEGMACGCFVVGSAGGGLADAIGPGGVTFPNGDATALAQALTLALERPPAGELDGAVAHHLARHTRRRVGEAHRAVLAAVLAGREVPGA
jgi:glycosyltransferase involved in cell wall biosynthesis